MDIVTLIGVAGATIVLIAFILGQLNKLPHTDVRYDALNALGSALLLWYAYLLSSYPFMVLNTVWLLVSLWDVVKWGRR